MSIRDKGKLWYEKTQNLCVSLNRSQKFFFFGTIVAVMAAAWRLIPFHQPFVTFVILSGLLFVSGVVSDILFVYTKVWGTTIGKALLLLLYALATTVAHAFAAQIVNEVVGYESPMLSNAVTFVAILLVPLFIFFFTCLIFLFVSIVSQFYLLIVTHAEYIKNNECFKSIIPVNLERYPIRTFVARMVIYPLAIGFFLSLSKHLGPKYELFIEKSTAAFVYHLEAIKFSRCNIPANTKAISVNENEIILAKRVSGRYTFKPQKCNHKIPSNKDMGPTRSQRP